MYHNARGSIEFLYQLHGCRESNLKLIKCCDTEYLINLAKNIKLRNYDSGRIDDLHTTVFVRLQ